MQTLYPTSAQLRRSARARMYRDRDMQARRSEFWFDFISPYAYLAWKQVRTRELDLRPVLFAALLDHHGQLGPAEIPAKRDYTFKHVVRRAHDLGVPIVPPPGHPFNSLLGLRLASVELGHEDRVRLIDALFDATWAGGPGIHEAGVVAGVLREAGFEAEPLLAAASNPETKQRLLAATREAISKGVFGVPTFIAEHRDERTGEARTESFWGSDSIGDLDRFSRGEDPVTSELLARWQQLPSLAERPAANRASR